MPSPISQCTRHCGPLYPTTLWLTLVHSRFVPSLVSSNLTMCLVVAASISDQHIPHCAHLSITCAPFILLRALIVHGLNCSCVHHALVLSTDLLGQRLGTWAFLTSTIGFCSPTIFSMNIQARTHHQRRLLLDGWPRFHVDIRTMALSNLSSRRRCSEPCGFRTSSCNIWKQSYSAMHVVLCLRTQYGMAWLWPSVKNTCFPLSGPLQFHMKIHFTGMKSAITATCSGFRIRNFAKPFERWYKVDLLFYNRTMKMMRPMAANLGATWRRRANRTSWIVSKWFPAYRTTWASSTSHWRIFSVHTSAFKPWVQESNLQLFIVGF